MNDHWSTNAKQNHSDCDVNSVFAIVIAIDQHISHLAVRKLEICEDRIPWTYWHRCDGIPFLRVFLSYVIFGCGMMGQWIICDCECGKDDGRVLMRVYYTHIKLVVSGFNCWLYDSSFNRALSQKKFFASHSHRSTASKNFTFEGWRRLRKFARKWAYCDSLKL